MHFYVDGVALLKIDATVGQLISAYSIKPTAGGVRTIGDAGLQYLSVLCDSVQDANADYRVKINDGAGSEYSGDVPDGSTAVLHKFGS